MRCIQVSTWRVEPQSHASRGVFVVVLARDGSICAMERCCAVGTTLEMPLCFVRADASRHSMPRMEVSARTPLEKDASGCDALT